MIQENQKLNPKLFDKDVEQAYIRDGYGKGLVELGEKDKRVVALCADLAESTRTHWFKEKFPERYVEVGVAEQNMAALASGLANYGKIPFIASYAAFSPGRNNEQIRTTISLQNLPVKIVGAHAGISVGPDGATHQALEDIALMRVQPKMTVIVPVDEEEARKATIAMVLDVPGPAYIRLGREKTPVITTSESPFEVGRANVLFDDGKSEVVIFGTGALLYNALITARDLAKEGISVSVVNVHTIKPLDRATIISYAKKTRAVVTVEEHQIAGGFSSLIAETLAKEYPVPMEFVGVKDKFGQSGTPEELLEHYGMGVKSIKEAVKKVMGRKG